MANQPINPKTNNPVRPEHLHPPTTLPLRHCSHNEEDTPIDEVECLLSLLCPNKETMRNKEHYTLATADPPSVEATTMTTQNSDSANPKKRKRTEDLQAELNKHASALRAGARSIPGVPIIYVKRSVMILEPMSVPSEKVRLGVEKGKFKTGVEGALNAAGGKRKREEDEQPRQRGLKKAKGPNPLSVKKPKKREKRRPEDQGRKQKMQKMSENAEGGTTAHGTGSEAESTTKSKRKRRHKHSKTKGDSRSNNSPTTAETAGAEGSAASAPDAKGDAAE
ncbi:hypothetical protein VTN96DRAFT_7155 [Rasamsonia emersonii]